MLQDDKEGLGGLLAVGDELVWTVDVVAEDLTTAGCCERKAGDAIGLAGFEAGVGGEHGLHVFGVAWNIGSNAQYAAGAQQNAEDFDKGGDEEAPDLMLGLPPGVGKEDVEDMDAVGRENAGESIAGVVVGNPQVLQAACLQLFAKTTGELAFDFEGEEVALGMLFGPIEDEFSTAAADFYFEGGGDEKAFQGVEVRRLRCLQAECGGLVERGGMFGGRPAPGIAANKTFSLFVTA